MKISKFGNNTIQLPVASVYEAARKKLNTIVNPEELNSISKEIFYQEDFSNSELLRYLAGYQELLSQKGMTIQSGIEFLCEKVKITAGRLGKSYSQKIVPCPKGFLSQDSVYYYGTQIKRSCLSADFYTNIVNTARALGKAIYCTPDKKVAAYHAGLTGEIMSLRVKDDSVALVTQAAHENIVHKLNNLLSRKDDGFTLEQGNAMLELLMHDLFELNNYNAVYSPRAYTQTLDFNKLIGREERQLAVLSSDDISILPKTPVEKFKNFILLFNENWKP